jgi:hypothetical protein
VLKKSAHSERNPPGSGKPAVFQDGLVDHPQFSHDGQLVSLPPTRHTMVDGRRNCPFARLWICFGDEVLDEIGEKLGK